MFHLSGSNALNSVNNSNVVLCISVSADPNAFNQNVINLIISQVIEYYIKPDITNHRKEKEY